MGAALDVARGLPFLKGKTLKLMEEPNRVLSRSWELRDSRAEEGENGSSDFGVFSLMGLPAKAWDCKLMDMVGIEAEQENDPADGLKELLWESKDFGGM